ncbi:MAG: dienelactone hydrolase family protein [Bacteroidota bacterium]
MTTKFRRCILFLFFSFSCFTSIAQSETSAPRAPIPRKSAIKNLDFKAGVQDHDIPLSNGEHWKVRISIPPHETGQQLPLVLALHWAGGHQTYQEYSDCLAFPALDTLGAIIVAPSSEGRHWIDPDMETRTLQLLRLLKKYGPVDEQKIIITGYSNGGIASWQYAQRNPGLFCASIPMAGFYKAAKIKTPVYAIHGQKDELFGLPEIQQALQQSKRKGTPIELSVIEAYSHYMACAYVEALRSAVLKVKAGWK